MAGIHSLQQIEGFGAPDFADDDAFRPHTQTIAHKIAHGDLTFTLEIRRAGLQANHVRLLQLQFGCVLARDDSLVVVDVTREAVEQSGFTGTSTAGNKSVNSATADDFEKFSAFRRDGSKADELLEREFIFFEFADGQSRPIDRQRRHDGVDARPVRQAGIADWRSFVDAATDLADDALTNIEKLLIVAETNSGLVYLPGDFNVN